MGIRGPLELISRTTSGPQSRLWESLPQTLKNLQKPVMLLVYNINGPSAVLTHSKVGCQIFLKIQMMLWSSITFCQCRKISTVFMNTFWGLENGPIPQTSEDIRTNLSEQRNFFSYLNNSFKGFVTFLICARLLQVPTDSNIFAKKNLAVILKPIQNLEVKAQF